MATPLRRILDSSPLILLAKVGQIDLLRAGVSEIVVPDAVLSEVGARGPADPVFQQIQSTGWLKIVPAPRLRHECWLGASVPERALCSRSP